MRRRYRKNCAAPGPIADVGRRDRRAGQAERQGRNLRECAGPVTPYVDMLIQMCIPSIPVIGTMFALQGPMRLLYVTAIGLAGTALIASPMMRPQAQVADKALRASAERTPFPEAKPALTTAETPRNGVQVVDELVAADPVKALPARTRAERRPPPPPPTFAAPHRSLLARVFLGSGDHRPRPFPRPGS